VGKGVNLAKCIFCGGGGVRGNRMSGEHIWSDWMRDLLPLPGRDIVNDFVTIIDGATGTEKNINTRQRKARLTASVVPVVCCNCNNGWMNRIETAARIPLTHLIKREPFVVDAALQLALVNWAVLKTLVIENGALRGQPCEPICEQQARCDFKSHLAVPASFRIWIGDSSADHWRVQFFRHAALLTFEANPGSVKNVQTLTFGIGNVVFFVFAATEIEVYSRIEFSFDAFLVSIWPSAGDPISWPRSLVLNDADMVALSNTLMDLMRSDDVEWRPALPRSP
jgi:hypothetical protein